LEDDGFGAEAEVLDSKFNDLKKIVLPVWERTFEHAERPSRLEALTSVLNSSNSFLEKIKNTTLDDTPFTQVEIDTLEKLVSEVSVRILIFINYINQNNFKFNKKKSVDLEREASRRTRKTSKIC